MRSIIVLLIMMIGLYYDFIFPWFLFLNVNWHNHDLILLPVAQQRVIVSIMLTPCLDQFHFITSSCMV